MTLTESINKNLRELPDHKLVEVARFVRDLVPEAVKRQRKALRALHGSLDEETAKVLDEAVSASRQLPD